jgi:hypothetical protein
VDVGAHAERFFVKAQRLSASQMEPQVVGHTESGKEMRSTPFGITDVIRCQAIQASALSSRSHIARSTRPRTTAW